VHRTGRSTGDATDRFARFCLTRPYTSAGVTTLALLVMWNSARQVFESDGEHGWLDWVVVGFVLYTLVASYVVAPRWR
jgi:hypothetical protein